MEGIFFRYEMSMLLLNVILRWRFQAEIWVTPSEGYLRKQVNLKPDVLVSNLSSAIYYHEHLI